MLQHLEEAAEKYEGARSAFELARIERDAAIRRARASGASLQAIARVAGMTRERARQIIGDPDDRLTMESAIEVRCPTCGSAPGYACDGRSRRSFHAARHERRIGIAEGEVNEVDEDELTVMAARLADAE